MAQKQCDQCGETVDEAKAFCPACGHAFVEEEKRADQSGFDTAGGTMQFGQTMYNQMLSDMGLNIKERKTKETVRPDSLSQPAQVLKPVVQTLKPVAEPSAPTEKPSEPLKESNTWMIVGVVAIVLLLLLLILIVAAGFVWLRYYS